MQGDGSLSKEVSVEQCTNDNPSSSHSPAPSTRQVTTRVFGRALAPQYPEATSIFTHAPNSQSYCAQWQQERNCAAERSARRSLVAKRDSQLKLRRQTEVSGSALLFHHQPHHPVSPRRADAGPPHRHLPFRT